MVDWPRIEDKLFKINHDDFMKNALFTERRSWDTYCDGFFKSAEILVEQIIEKENYDTTLISTLFLYRHSIELRLKGLISIGQVLNGIDRKIPNHHQLLILWNDVRKLVEVTHPDGDKTVLNAVEVQIKEFDIIDKKSTTFRYPIDTNGNSIQCDLFIFDIQNLKIVMFKLNQFLETVDGMFHDFRQWQLDMENEMTRMGY